MNWERLPAINTNRLSLRWISAEDVDDVYTIYSDPEVMRYWSTPPLADRNAASKLVSEIHESFKRRELLQWGHCAAQGRHADWERHAFSSGLHSSQS